ncbi:hypothetical protein JYU34_005084 [Plutella xylostella]|uniref:Serpin domain-containing protein n=1 Tax=Plutella xylostella TaxID=51655 RepID=A0ABQ7QVW3_PLUXY|nr:hypothetical protein JYU34_005084 [Plutella xylostella]
MSLALFLIFFVAPLAHSANTGTPKPPTIDESVLQNVFGSPQSFYSQAVPVVPENGTLVDPDYWDSEDIYRPSSLTYDLFDLSITKRVAKSSADNFLMSPLGLKLALAILTEAATGTTQAELVSVLNFDKDRNTVRHKFASIVSSLKTKSPQYILDLGSRIYVDNTAKTRQRFAAIAEQFYNTELQNIDLSKPGPAAKDINAWVSEKTQGRISQLVTEADLASAVVLILNTLYFRGTWRHQFAPNETAAAPFYVTPSVQKQAHFMKVQNSFYYAESMKFDAKILRMPYLGRKYSMNIIVPNSLSGLPRVVENLSELRQEMTFLTEKVVDVTIPRFQFDYTTHFENILKELGVREAFEDTASFPGISRGQTLRQRLKVSNVLQKAGIEVNELGSTAYSATEISLVNKFGTDNDGMQEVIANKPFLFFIEDEATRQLLFSGRFADPTATIKMA